MSQELVSIPFHGDVIEATKDERGVWASLRRMCESLGLDHSGQLQKLRKRPWSNVEIISMLDSAGRKFEVVCLHLEALQGLRHLQGFTSVCKDFAPTRGFATPARLATTAHGLQRRTWLGRLLAVDLSCVSPSRCDISRLFLSYTPFADWAKDGICGIGFDRNQRLSVNALVSVKERF